MRTIWVAEQKRRAERQARDATNMPSPQEEEYPEEGNSFDMGSKGMFGCVNVSTSCVDLYF